MKDFPKQYIPSEHEDEIYKLWKESSFFNPDNINSDKSYCNILPPPNANGEAHLGHASGYAVMDIFGRYERMRGKKVLLLPGKDHAGIQTQVVFEKKIKEEQGKSRYEWGRKKFYKECFDFTKKSADYMRSQEKKLGISADWSREKFTLDPDVTKIALETFVKMYGDGMIYRGKRIINWCPRCATALSDIEVIHREENGKLYYIKYPIKNSKEFVTVATTRPETMLGDSAVAVNPKDKRYFNLIGKIAVLPLQNREIPIIADRKVEIEFGTGAVKVTPAHDPLDWKIGKEHKLGEIKAIDENAKITPVGGKCSGQNVLEARKNILKDLAALKLLEKEENVNINKSICERCKTAIEPLVSEQWFVNVDAKKFSLKKETLRAIRSGKINFYPENLKKVMIHWLTNLDDWCISRQIWWGHRLPVWYKSSDKSKIYVGIKAPEGEGWIQEEDTFDTWFSSGQWPYSTLGYPDGKDFKKFYPTDMMIMGRDILFFWAARMAMFGLYRTGKIPFKNLYFTGIVRDKDGFKMSKSRGNGIDPLEMTKKFGADALRLSLVMDIGPGQDTRLYEGKIASFRNFATKLWNIFRYAAQSDDNFKLEEKIGKRNISSIADKWIVSRLEETIKEVTEFMEAKNISLAQEKMRRFIWDDLADWYVEMNKVKKNTKALGFVLDKVVKLQHPFMPFVTEKIFGNFSAGNNLLMMSQWPKVERKFFDKKAEKDFDNLRRLIVKIRNIRASYRIDPQIIIEACGADYFEKEIIEKLARIKISKTNLSKKMLEVSSGKYSLKLDVAELIDVDRELNRLQKEEKNMEGLLAKTKNLLDNKKFVIRASGAVIAAARARQKEYEEKLEAAKESSKNLKKL